MKIVHKSLSKLQIVDKLLKELKIPIIKEAKLKLWHFDNTFTVKERIR